MHKEEIIVTMKAAYQTVFFSRYTKATVVVDEKGTVFFTTSDGELPPVKKAGMLNLSFGGFNKPGFPDGRDSLMFCTFGTDNSCPNPYSENGWEQVYPAEREIPSTDYLDRDEYMEMRSEWFEEHFSEFLPDMEKVYESLLKSWIGLSVCFSEESDWPVRNF